MSNPKYTVKEVDVSRLVPKMQGDLLFYPFTHVPSEHPIVIGLGLVGIRWWHYLIPGKVKRMKDAFNAKAMKDHDEKFGPPTEWFPVAGFDPNVLVGKHPFPANYGTPVKERLFGRADNE
jgi:hypothetical protein